MQTQQKPIGTYRLHGRNYPITDYITKAPNSQLLTEPVPLVDVPMMSDYRWQQMALEDRIAHPEKYPEEDLTVTVPHLRRWLAEHREAVIA